MAFSLTEEQQAAVDNRGGRPSGFRRSGLRQDPGAGGASAGPGGGGGRRGPLPGHHLYQGRRRRAAGPYCGGDLRPAGSAAQPTATSAVRPPWCTRRASPPSTPSVPNCCGSAATCWIWTRIFRLCDEGEAGILMLRALNDVLDKRYEAMDSDFAQLVDTMSAGRDDARLVQIVLDIRGRVQAHPNPRRLAGPAGAGLCPGGGDRPPSRPPGGSCC